MSSNIEIRKVAERLNLPNFHCITRDELKNIPMTEIMNIVMNTCHTKDERNQIYHWVCVYKLKDKRYHFCSFGAVVFQEVIDYFKGFDISTSNFRIQNWKSSDCGSYCLVVLYLLNMKI